MKNDELKEILLQFKEDVETGCTSVLTANENEALLNFITTRTEPKHADTCPECGGTGMKYLCECDLKESMGCDHCKDEETIPCPSCTGKVHVDKKKVFTLSGYDVMKELRNCSTPECYQYVPAHLYNSQQAEIDQLRYKLECDTCNGTGKAPVGKIRELKKLAQLHGFTLSEIDACSIGISSQQAEIERLKEYEAEYKKADEENTFLQVENIRLKAENMALKEKQKILTDRIEDMYRNGI